MRFGFPDALMSAIDAASLIEARPADSRHFEDWPDHHKLREVRRDNLKLRTALCGILLPPTAA